MAIERYPVAVLASGIRRRRERVSIEEYARLAREAEAKGADWFIVNDGPAQIWEPHVLLAHLTLQTRSIGVGVPIATSFNEPYHVARILATIDHFGRGRAAWQLIFRAAYDRDAQYVRIAPGADEAERARELYDVVRKLWDSWEDGAVVNDKAAGKFLDPDKIRHTHHRGKYFGVRGPSPVPRPPQGHPVSYAIAESGEVRETEALAEVVFLTGETGEELERQYRRLLERRGSAAAPVIFVPRALAGQGISVPVGGVYIEADELGAFERRREAAAGTLRERLSLERPAARFAGARA